MTQTRYRVTLTLLGLAFATVVVGAVILSPRGDAPDLPAALESYSPTDGAIVLRQTRIEIDLAPGYGLELVVDGVRIPPAELQVVEETGRFSWAPGPTQTFPEWVPGFHTVEAQWDRATGLPDPGSLRWSFRVQ